MGKIEWKLGSIPLITHCIYKCKFKSIVIITIIAWLVLEWTLLFPRATSMQKADSWKILQLRCPR